MKKIICAFFIIIFLFLLTACDDVEGNGKLLCNNEIYDYQIDYVNSNVKEVNLVYKDYNYDTSLSNDKIIDTYFDKYCGKNIDGYSCSVSLMKKYVYIRTYYDFEKLSDDNLKKLEKLGLIYNYKNVSKLKDAIESNKDIDCLIKENKTK